MAASKPGREKRSRNRRRARRVRAPASALGISRRLAIAGGLGVLVAGFGVGTLIRRHGRPGSSEATVAVVRDTATENTAVAGGVDPLMEEAPLPTDVYVSRPLMPVPPPAAAPLPSTRPATLAGTPLWQRNARPLVSASGIPAVAIVIDDLGLDAARTNRAIGLDRNLTLAFMTYADHLPAWLGQARDARHELLAHVPMQPEAASVDPGPNALTVSLSQAEILNRLRWGLNRMEFYIGANNHMGSRFTEDADGMRIVMEELRARGLLFLDSRTTGRSACGAVAASVGLPFASRNVFLDNDTSAEAVRSQIMVLEGVARQHGTAIGIGHPHDGTLTALAEWLPLAASRGIAVVPLTSAMRLAADRA